jgi:hypothetical protein
MRRMTIWVLAAVLGASAAPALAACNVFATYKGVPLHRFADSKVYAYRTDFIAIDADGAPNAYHPQDRGIDALANAGFQTAAGNQYWSRIRQILQGHSSRTRASSRAFFYP